MNHPNPFIWRYIERVKLYEECFEWMEMQITVFTTSYYMDSPSSCAKAFPKKEPGGNTLQWQMSIRISLSFYEEKEQVGQKKYVI